MLARVGPFGGDAVQQSLAAYSAFIDRYLVGILGEQSANSRFSLGEQTFPYHRPRPCDPWLSESTNKAVT